MWLKIKQSSLLFLPLFLLFAAGVLVYRGQLFSFQSFSCKSQFGLCSAQEEEKIKSFLGRSLFFLDTGDIKEVLSSDFSVKGVFIQKVIPNKLNVFLEKRKPLVAVSVSEFQGGVFLIDREGIVLGFSENSALPLLLVDKDEHLVVGEKVSGKIVAASEILYLTYKLEADKPVKGELQDGKLLVETQGVDVYYPLDKDPRVLVGALQLILVRSRIDGKLPKSIDLQYSNPVLIF